MTQNRYGRRRAAPLTENLSGLENGTDKDRPECDYADKSIERGMEAEEGV